MAGKRSSKKAQPAKPAASPKRARAARPSALLDTRIIYCGDWLDPTEPRPSGSGAFPPDGCVDRLYLWHRFPTGDSNSNRNYEVFWGETKEKRPVAAIIGQPSRAMPPQPASLCVRRFYERRSRAADLGNPATSAGSLRGTVRHCRGALLWGGF